MENLRSICIIHTEKDKVLGIYFKEFFEFIGLMCFNYTYYEGYDVLEEGENEYDVILGINLPNNLEKHFRHYGKLYINAGEEDDKGKIIPITSAEIWENKDEKKTLEGKLIKGVLDRIFEEIKPAMLSSCNSILKSLSYVYCTWNVMHLVFYGCCYHWYKDLEPKQKNQQMDRYSVQYYSWIRVIDDLEKINASYIE